MAVAERTVGAAAEDDDLAQGTPRVRRCDVAPQPVRHPGIAPRRARQAQSWPSRRSSASSIGALVGAGGEVLPAAVADDEGDVGALARLDRLGGLAERGVQDRAGGDAGEDALELEQLAHPAYGVARADREAGVDQRRVVQLGDEALVEVAQAVDQLAVARLGGDDPHLRLVAPEEAADAHQRAGGAEAGDEVGDRRAGRRGSRGRCPPRARGRWRGCRTGRASPSRGAPRRPAWRPGPPRWSRRRRARRRSRRPTSAAAGGAPRRCSRASRRRAGSP